MAAEPTVPALATTKRKFYKLLDGLSSSTSVKTNKAASTATLNEPASKRSRLSVDSETFSRPSSVRIIGSRVLAKTPDGTIVKVAASPAKTPNYQPYSQDAFLSRLKTFSDVKVWTYKPSEVSEVEWAKRGWVCEAKQVDTVACKGGCEARVVIRLERGRERARTLQSLGDDGEEAGGEEETPDWDGAADDELVKRYAGLIVEGHSEGCLWRTGGCKDDIYRIRMTDAAVWQKDLADRYQSLLSIESSLPERLKIPQPDELKPTGSRADGAAPAQLSIDFVSTTLATVLTSSAPLHGSPQAESAATPTPNGTAASLSLFGWRGSSPHNIHLASCDRCFQRIGLWLYTSNPSNKALPSTESGIADDDILSFDLSGLHRDYCPWINGESQAGLGAFRGLAAWEILLRLVENKTARERSEREPVADVGSMEEEENGAEEKTRGELEKEDKDRESRLARLKRAFSVRKPDKKENRKSWKTKVGG